MRLATHTLLADLLNNPGAEAGRTGIVADHLTDATAAGLAFSRPARLLAFRRNGGAQASRVTLQWTAKETVSRSASAIHDRRSSPTKGTTAEAPSVIKEDD